MGRLNVGENRRDVSDAGTVRHCPYERDCASYSSISTPSKSVGDGFGAVGGLQPLEALT